MADEFDPNYKYRPVGFTAEIEPVSDVGRWKREEVKIDGKYITGFLFEKRG